MTTRARRPYQLYGMPFDSRRISFKGAEADGCDTSFTMELSLCRFSFYSLCFLSPRYFPLYAFCFAGYLIFTFIIFFFKTSFASASVSKNRFRNYTCCFISVLSPAANGVVSILLARYYQLLGTI